MFRKDFTMQNLQTDNIVQVNFGTTNIKMDDYKTCSKCKRTLPIENFKLKSKFSKEGKKFYRTGVCKDCEKEQRRLYRANLPEEKRKAINERKRLAYQKRKQNLTPEQKEQLKLKHKQYKEQLPEWKKEEQNLMFSIKVNENRRKWLKHKEIEGCFHCKGENIGKSIALFGEAYDSHHVHEDKKTNSKGNTVELSKMVSSGYSWESIEEELSKCVTLCKLCHSQWHAKNMFIDFSKWKNYNSNLKLKI